MMLKLLYKELKELIFYLYFWGKEKINYFFFRNCGV